MLPPPRMLIAPSCGGQSKSIRVATATFGGEVSCRECSGSEHRMGVRGLRERRLWWYSCVSELTRKERIIRPAKVGRSFTPLHKEVVQASGTIPHA